jgi:hypothetical protein
MFNREQDDKTGAVNSIIVTNYDPQKVKMLQTRLCIAFCVHFCLRSDQRSATIYWKLHSWILLTSHGG